MKRGRKTTVSIDDLRRELIPYREQILQNNKLIKSSNVLWESIITKCKWSITSKALWTRIFKFSPNYETFFEPELNEYHEISVPIGEDNTYDDLLFNSDHSESNGEDEIKVLTIFVTSQSWKEMQRNDGLKSKLKPGVWTDTISEIIYDTHSINCVWSYKSHEVATSESSQYFFFYSATCFECGVKMTGKVLKHNKLLDPLVHGLTINLYLNGNYNVPHFKKRRLGGEHRKNVSSYLLKTNTTSSRYRKDQAKILCKNLFESESVLLPRLETIRKAKSEQNCKTRSDADDLISLNIMQNCYPWQNIIKNIGFQPFFVHYWSPDQVRVYNSFVKKERAAKICIDATGNIVKKVKRPSGLSKYIFIYLIVIKLPDEHEGQISVSQMLSESHNTNSISYWLLEWRRNGASLPKEVVTDFSMALINSVCIAFAGCAEGSSTYIERCMNVLNKSPGNKLPTCFVRVDVAHLLKFITTWRVLNETHVRRRVKEFFVRAIGQLVMVTDITEAIIIIKNIFIVMLSECEGDEDGVDTNCEVAKKFFMIRFASGVEQSMVQSVLDYQLPEENTNATDVHNNNNVNEFEDNQDPIIIKSWVSNILSNAKVEATMTGSRDNLMYLPKLMMPFKLLCYKLPLWTSIMTKSFAYGNLTASSASVESHINEIKHYSGINSNIRVDDFIKFHTSYLEGSMKLVSGLRYFQRSTTPINTNKEIISDDNYLSDEIQSFSDVLNEIENWGGKGGSGEKNNTQNMQMESTKKDNADGDNDHNLSSDSEIVSIIEADKFSDKFMTTNNINFMENSQKDAIDISKEILKLKSKPEKKKRSKYLNPDSEWMTIPIDQMTEPSKICVLPNGGTAICGITGQKNENGIIYNLSNTCGFDSLIQILTVACCDSFKLRQSKLENKDNVILSFATEMASINKINKAILTKRCEILKTFFEAERIPNNMMRINCDCNVVEILKRFNLSSMKQIKNCTNQSCSNQNLETTFHSLLLNFENENFSKLQEKIEKYEQFTTSNNICTRDKCSGILKYETVYSNIIFLAFSNTTNKHQTLPDEVKTCILKELPNMIHIKEKLLYLRGVIAYNSPLTKKAIGHYLCYAKRNHIYWEVHDDTNSKVKPIRSSTSAKVALMLYTE